MGNIIISSDSTCDLSAQLIAARNVRIIPLRVEYRGKLCSDGVDVTPEQIYADFRADGTLPKTSAIAPIAFEEYFASIKEHPEDEIIHFSISGEFSSTHQNACIAAENVPGVHCVDSRNLSTGIGLQVLRAADMRDGGAGVQEILDELARIIPKVNASFVLDQLQFLRAGGRCSSVTAMSASVLNIKPCIVVENGRMHAAKKYMGSLAKALQRYTADRLTGKEFDRTRVFITSTGTDPALVEAVRAQVEAAGLFDEILVTYAGCTVSSHCGPGTLGVLFIEK